MMVDSLTVSGKVDRIYLQNMASKFPPEMLFASSTDEKEEATTTTIG